MIERKTFTYDGQNSADYDLYIAGDSVYDAPTRDMDMITIPGRNGQLSIDQGRFENITVTYPAFVWADTQAEFRTKVRAIRNWLCPKHSYYKLSDEYNPESYRLGIYKSGLEVEPVFFNRAGRFELSFDCKPQRFLLSGDEPITLGEWGETETYSGSIASFDGTETTAIKSLKVNITPKQSGSGDPSPSNVRPISGVDTVGIQQTGANLLPKTSSGSGSGITWVVNDDGSIVINGTATANQYITAFNCSLMPNVSYTFSVFNNNVPSGTAPKVFLVTADNDNKYFDINSANKTYTFTHTKEIIAARIRIYAGSVCSNFVIKPMVTVGDTTPTAYEPYEAETITTNLPQTVYGGTLDVVSGRLVIDKVKHEVDNITQINANWNSTNTVAMTRTVSDSIRVDVSRRDEAICENLPNALTSLGIATAVGGSTTDTPCFGFNANQNNSQYIYLRLPKSLCGETVAEVKAYLSANPVSIVYPIITPIEIQLTPTQVNTLLGQNNIWADAGTVEVEIGENPNILVNPTPFESCPVFEVEGSGTLTVGNISMNIVNSGTTIIDSEMMEAYEEENGAIISRNDSVSGEFPKLESGNNNIETVGLTSVKVTPRWWEV